MQHNRELAKLQSEIELLEQKVREFEIAAEIRALGVDRIQVATLEKSTPNAHCSYLWNFLVTALYPLVFWVVRKIYSIAYQSKK